MDQHLDLWTLSMKSSTHVQTADMSIYIKPRYAYYIVCLFILSDFSIYFSHHTERTEGIVPERTYWSLFKWVNDVNAHKYHVFYA